MPYALTIELADEAYQHLAQRAQKERKPLEALAAECLAAAILDGPNGSPSESPSKPEEGGGAERRTSNLGQDPLLRWSRRVHVCANGRGRPA